MAVTELLQSALERGDGTHTLDDVAAAIRRGEMQLWNGLESAIVTQVIPYPRLTAVNLFLVAGRLDEVRQLEAGIADAARQRGITRLQIGGRAGWQRALGYQSLGHLMVRDL